MVIDKSKGIKSYFSERQEVLTRCISNSFGGNSKTLIIATIKMSNIEKTKYTLEFAKIHKEIDNKPVANVTYSKIQSIQEKII